MDKLLRVLATQGPRGELRHRCEYAPCRKESGQLLRCTGCLAVRFCTRDHQVADRPYHKSGCNQIKKSRKKLAHEDGLVRNATPGFMTPANAFETSAGHFWGIDSTRDYMRA